MCLIMLNIIKLVYLVNATTVDGAVQVIFSQQAVENIMGKDLFSGKRIVQLNFEETLLSFA